MDLNLGMGAPFQRTALFRAFRAAVGTYVVGGKVTLSASEPFEVEAIATSHDASNLALFELMSTAGTEFLAVRQSGGSLKVSTFGKTPGDSSVAHELHRFSNVSLVWDTVQFHLYENGSLLYSVVPTDTAWIDDEFVFRIGRVSSGGGAYHEGIPYLYRMWTGGDRNTGAEVLRYRDFTRADGIVPNELATPSAELFSIADVSLGVGWSINGDELVYSGSATDFVNITTPLDDGKRYLVDIKASAGTFRDRFDRDFFAGVSSSARLMEYTGGLLRLQGSFEQCRLTISISETPRKPSPTRAGIQAGTAQRF